MNKNIIESVMNEDAVYIKESISKLLGEKAIIEIDKYKKKLSSKIFNDKENEDEQDDDESLSKKKDKQDD